MGRKRLIVQADLTSEEDQAFLAWVKQKLRRRKLAEEIRLGLRLQYEWARGQAGAAYPSAEHVEQPRQEAACLPEHLDEREKSPDTSAKLKGLLQSF